MSLPHHMQPQVALSRSYAMNEGVNEDLAIPAESSISDDLRKAFLQLGAQLAWQYFILDVVRNTEGRQDPRTILHTPHSCRQKALEMGGIFILDWNGPSIVYCEVVSLPPLKFS
ncbi:hypothetical protein EG68_12396 [Paragonimus skrjabini miyazakii]|uniref:Uncharacterized protein n=1 Tax=Paragonimus skrjabini miyazakii TaxID=59628 RepID=A0A8S9YCW0_9TREM|nr:hypothetical protein EG68_12396 [Paragonimus skrjabini miyazakii]